MPKVLSILIAAISLTTALVAQEIQIRPRLVAGDAFQLEVTRAREDSSNPRANYTARTPVSVRVVSAGAEGFILDWRPGLTRLEGAAAADPVLGTAGRILGDVQLRIVLDADGAFERLANEAELLPKLQAAIDFVIRESQRGMKPDEAKRAETLVRSLLSPANLVNIATRDPQTYVSMYGAELRVAEAVEVPLEQPNPFGGEPLPAILRVRLDTVTAESAGISSTVTYQGDALKKMTIGLLSQAAVAPPPEELAKFRLDMSDESRYVFDRRLGLFREVTTDRLISGNGARRVDRCVIRLLTEPRR